MLPLFLATFYYSKTVPAMLCNNSKVPKALTKPSNIGLPKGQTFVVKQIWNVRRTMFDRLARAQRKYPLAISFRKNEAPFLTINSLKSLICAIICKVHNKKQSLNLEEWMVLGGKIWTLNSEVITNLTLRNFNSKKYLSAIMYQRATIWILFGAQRLHTLLLYKATIKHLIHPSSRWYCKCFS